MTGDDLPWFPNWPALFGLQLEPATIKHAFRGLAPLKPSLDLFILPAIAPPWPFKCPCAAWVLLDNLSQFEKESDNVETDASFMKDPGLILSAKPTPVDRVPPAPCPARRTAPQVDLLSCVEQGEKFLLGLAVAVWRPKGV